MFVSMQHSTQWLKMRKIVDELLMNHSEINLCLLERRWGGSCAETHCSRCIHFKLIPLLVCAPVSSVLLTFNPSLYFNRWWLHDQEGCLCILNSNSHAWPFPKFQKFVRNNFITTKGNKYFCILWSQSSKSVHTMLVLYFRKMSVMSCKN